MRRLLAVVGALGILVSAAAFSARGVWPWQRLSVETPVIVPVVERRVASDTLRSGETVSELFARRGIGAIDLGTVVGLLGLDARRIRAGQVFHFGYHDSAPHPIDVTVRTKHTEETRVVREASNWTAEVRPIEWTSHQVRLEGRIETSLYDALIDAEISEAIPSGDRVRLAWDLADVFAWSVDFSRDLQPGDRFTLLFEREVSELGESRVGNILASHLEVGGRRQSAFRFETQDGRKQYFDTEGTSLKRAFLRAPVEFRRISSRFSSARFHPVLGVYRRHEGIDYAANSGTPVMAAGDGSVLRAARAGGYGLMVELRHKSGITTRYAHLRGFAPGVRTGARVRQGDVIGYVGATGLASGPHLHYEFRQNGVARNPGSVDLGNGDPVSPQELAAFQAERDRLTHLMRLGPQMPAAIAADVD